jgi:hypothetical protein
MDMSSPLIESLGVIDAADMMWLMAWRSYMLAMVDFSA